MRRTTSPDSAGFTLSAWVDESVIVGGDERPGAYTPLRSWQIRWPVKISEVRCEL
jgi:hypothetical protein